MNTHETVVTALEAANDARAIAEAVTMERLLQSLGIDVNERTRRARCILHSGSNPTALSWRDDGRWHCFACDRGGDRIGLVRAVRHCSFREAVEFLAALAGVECGGTTLSPTQIECARREKKSLRRDATALLTVEKRAWLAAQVAVLHQEQLARNAGQRLDALHRGEPERFAGEEGLAWEALAEVYREMPRVVARYSALSFAAAKNRFNYALDPQALESAADEALKAGYVADEKGYRIEVQL